MENTTTTTTENTVENENTREELKHLEFVKVAVFNALIFASTLYEYAKENSGPLKSGVKTVEDTVKTVVNPVFEKFKDVPNHLLVFIDKKVDVAKNKFDERAPSVAKLMVSKATAVVQKASDLTQTLISEAQTKGIIGTASYAVEKSKECLTEQTVKTWWALNRVPLFATVAQVTVPVASRLSDKYNGAVTNMSDKGYTVFTYLPLIPIDKITETFKRREEDTKQMSNGGDNDSVSSDKKTS